MAAISSIRKHGVALMLIIGFALLAFILGDLTQVRQTFSNKNVMAKVDGKKMDKAYSEQYEQNTALMRILQNKSSFDESETYQIHEMTWRQMLQDAVLDKELKALGLQYSNQMIEDFKADMLASLSSNQPNQFLGQFANALAQMYGPENAMAILSNIDQYANNDQTRELYSAYQAIVRFALSAEKSSHYSALVQNTMYFSDPLAKKIAKENRTALVSLMPVNPQAPAFNSLSPSVTEQEMKDFYKAHKDDIFTVHERNRDIDVAVFPINPTPQDLKAIEDSVRADYQQFATAADLAAYSAEKGNGAVDSTYYKSSDINIPALDSLIFKSAVGSFIEPYNYENQKWYFGKVYGGASRPDSIHVATIELPFKSAGNESAKYSKNEAKALADSLKDVILKNQATIFQLQPNYVTSQKQDTAWWLPERGTIPSLYDGLLATANGGVYIFSAPNGYIVFQVLERTAPIEKRQFVIYDYDIAASDATVNAIKSQANQFAASISNDKQLVDAAAKKGVQVVNGVSVLPMAATVSQQLPACRDIVSWAFSDDVKKDDISDVINVDRLFFAVAAVKNVRENGQQKYKDVKNDIEAQLKAEKKVDLVAEQVKKALSSSNLETLAQQYNTQVTDSVMLSFAGDLYQNRGVEGRAIATIFNAQPNKPVVAAGKNMVYVANVLAFNETPASQGLIGEKNALRSMVMGRDRTESTLITHLLNNVKIIDNRGRFYQK